MNDKQRQFDYDRGFAAGAAERETLRAELAEVRDLLTRVVNSGALSSPQFEGLEADCCAVIQPKSNGYYAPWAANHDS